MANFAQISGGLQRGYLRGRQTGGGRLGALGSAISKVAKGLKEERVSQQELGQKRGLLGYSALLEGKIEPTETGGIDIPSLGRFKPIRKKDETQFITGPKGKIVGQRPKGSVFEPSGTSTEISLSGALSILSDPFKSNQLKRNYPNVFLKAEQVVKDALGEDVLGKIENQEVNPGAVERKPKNIVPKRFQRNNIIDTNW